MFKFSFFKGLDWVLLAPIFLIMLAGLITNYPIEAFSFDTLFFKQSVFVLIAIIILIFGHNVNSSLLRGPLVSLILYSLSVVLLVALLLFAPEINGAQSWFVFGPIAFQPVDFIKIALVIVLARYLATRHIHIRHIRLVLISIAITGILFLLVFKQPDLGSSFTLFAIWAGIIFVSEVSKKHIAGLLILAFVVVSVGWQFVPTYQRDRVLSFVDPLSNLQTTGYNAYQSKVTIGSGKLLGKGIGEGTQSKLGFLPLYESDFVFAAFAEEWGFVGVLILMFLYMVILMRLLYHAIHGRTNFEILFITGITSLLFTHILIHTGVNSGIFPVTGITLPFMSYGGSHLIAEAIAIAIVISMSRNNVYVRYDEFRDESLNRNN